MNTVSFPRRGVRQLQGLAEGIRGGVGEVARVAVQLPAEVWQSSVPAISSGFLGTGIEMTLC